MQKPKILVAVNGEEMPATLRQMFFRGDMELRKCSLTEISYVFSEARRKGYNFDALLVYLDNKDFSGYWGQKLLPIIYNFARKYPSDSNGKGLKGIIIATEKENLERAEEIVSIIKRNFFYNRIKAITCDESPINLARDIKTYANGGRIGNSASWAFPQNKPSPK